MATFKPLDIKIRKFKNNLETSNQPKTETCNMFDRVEADMFSMSKWIEETHHASISRNLKGSV